MLFLPPESRAALFALGNYFDAKMSRLKHGADVETERFRQAQYINWCTLKLIPDPCGADHGYECIAACFAENLIMDCKSLSTTVKGYVRRRESTSSNVPPGIKSLRLLYPPIGNSIMEKTC